MNNNNTVELIGYYGGDKTHALSAWTSTFEELNIKIPDRIEDRIDVIFDYVKRFKKKKYDELLKMLASDGHLTPYEKSTLHFQVNTDIASHIHLLKHRIGTSVSSESARYKELKEDKFYIPDDWPDEWKTKLTEYTKTGLDLYHNCLNDLVSKGFDRKRAKESSRFFRNYNTQITADVMFNFRSFMHFQKLRNSEHAQKEIREIAEKMLEKVKELDAFKYSLIAFGYL